MSSSLDRLVTMANQIGRFFGPQRQGDAVAGIADHLEKFWDPRMKTAIVGHLAAGGAGLDGPVREAVGRLKEAKREASLETGR
ncbi:formate dehydrogenase subunit delta [soil metagenome]